MFGPARTDQLLRDSGEEIGGNKNPYIQHADGGLGCY